jgi:hypothetical protein
MRSKHVVRRILKKKDLNILCPDSLRDRDLANSNSMSREPQEQAGGVAKQ